MIDSSFDGLKETCEDDTVTEEAECSEEFDAKPHPEWKD